MKTWIKTILKAIKWRLFDGIPITLAISSKSGVTFIMTPDGSKIEERKITLGIFSKSIDISLYHELAHYTGADFDQVVYDHILQICMSHLTDSEFASVVNSLECPGRVKEVAKVMGRPTTYATVLTEEVMANRIAYLSCPPSDDSYQDALTGFITYLPVNTPEFKQSMIRFAERYIKTGKCMVEKTP